MTFLPLLHALHHLLWESRVVPENSFLQRSVLPKLLVEGCEVGEVFSSDQNEIIWVPLEELLFYLDFSDQEVELFDGEARNQDYLGVFVLVKIFPAKEE